MHLEEHFTLLVYPFRHAAQAGGVPDLAGRWVPRLQRFEGPDLAYTLDDTYFFLPAPRRLLFPESALFPERIDRQVEAAERLAAYSPQRLAGALKTARALRDGVLRLTYAAGPLAPVETFDLVKAEPTGTFSVPLKLHWVDVALFPQGVGFLVLKVSLHEDRFRVARLSKTLLLLRQVHPPTVGHPLAQWALPDGLRFTGQAFIDYLLQGLSVTTSYYNDSLHAYLKRAERVPLKRQTQTDDGQVFGFYFRHFTYVRVVRMPGAAPDTPFASPAQRVLYELATCTDTRELDYAPHASGVKQLFDEGHIAIWANWEALTLHDSVVFTGFNHRSDTFVEHVLPYNVEGDYFNLYQLALYQKIWLSLFSGQLVRPDVDLHKNLAAARRLSEAFTLFRNHYWFAEVTAKPQGTHLFRQFQRGLGVSRLYADAEHEIDELQRYYEGVVERRNTALLSFITFLGGPTALWSTMIILLQSASPRTLLLVGVLLYLVSGIGWLFWQRWTK